MQFLQTQQIEQSSKTGFFTVKRNVPKSMQETLLGGVCYWEENPLGIHLELIFNKIYSSNKLSCQFPSPQEIRNLSLEERKTAAIEPLLVEEKLEATAINKRGKEKTCI